MMDSVAFDNERYIREQTRYILERVERFNHKLYLEFGGKLLYDYHAARVLPGYDPNVKVRLLQQLKVPPISVRTTGKTAPNCSGKRSGQNPATWPPDESPSL